MVVPYDPLEIVGNPLEKPGPEHFLGSNALGQDIFSRLLYGTRATLLAGFIGGFLLITIGSVIGITAGYYGGKIEEFITRLIDIQMTVPTFPLLIVLTMFFTPKILVICILIGILGWTNCARVIRSQVLSLTEMDFIYAAKAIGAGSFYIMRRHIWPNILPPVIVKFVFASQNYMLMGVGLGFLGLGDPSTIDWGQMINYAYTGGGFALGLWWWLTLKLLIALCFMSGCTGHKTADEPVAQQENYKTITDMRGEKVKIPQNPERVIAISRSLIDTTMYIFGVEDKLVGGSFYKMRQQEPQYVYNGVNYTVNTWIGQVLNPKIKELPNVGAFGGPYGIISVETIAKLNPDLIIIRDFNDSKDEFAKFLENMKRLNIPVVVLKSLNCYDKQEVNTMYQEIKILGEIFDKKAKAQEIVDYLDNQVKFIKERTRNIKEADKPEVLYLGIPKSAEKEGSVGLVFGNDQIESVLMEDYVNANNAFKATGTPMVSAEQLLNINPDIIILPTSSGHHPPRELYDEKRFRNIQDLKVIKEKKVYALAATPCKSERLEYPINLMIEARAVYPEKFKDVDLDQWIEAYFRGLYNADDNKVKELKSALMLEYLEITK